VKRDERREVKEVQNAIGYRRKLSACEPIPIMGQV